MPDMNPDQVWQEMASNPDSALVDVRTRPEWAFVGIPDVSGIERQAVLVEWRTYPELAVNPDFIGELSGRLAGRLPGTLYFICRSGQRSRDAAEHVAAACGSEAIRCVNVAEGFEGDLNAERHRGGLNGWKLRGLPWRQS